VKESRKEKDVSKKDGKGRKAEPAREIYGKNEDFKQEEE
jgi:hypothetical protein